MTLTDFNRGAEFTAGLLDEFAASGNPLIDELWRKPTRSARARDKSAVALFEALLAGSPRDLRARTNQTIRTLPLVGEITSSFYLNRTLRGDSNEWADSVTLLLIRMPVANVIYRNNDYGDAYGNARLLINACLNEIFFSSNVDDLDYDQSLEARMASIVDVVAWFAKNSVKAKQDIGLAMYPLMSYLWRRREDGQLTDNTRESVQRLYTFLDQNLDVCKDTQGAWPSVHEYCLKALGIAKQNSALWQLQDDIPELVNSFRRSLSHDIGRDLAERLLSERDLQVTELRRPEHATDILLRLLRARELWTGTVGLGIENTYDVLHRELDRIRNWRDLNDTIRIVADVDAPASDEQMAELVHSLPGAGNLIAEQIVLRALRCARSSDFSKTRQALKDLPVFGATAVVPFFNETLKKVRQGGF